MEARKMKQKRIVKWITSFLLILLMFVGFGSTLTHAKDAPKTDVIITKVETKDKAKDMTLDQLANGVNVADYFTDGKVIRCFFSRNHRWLALL